MKGAGGLEATALPQHGDDSEDGDTDRDGLADGNGALLNGNAGEGLSLVIVRADEEEEQAHEQLLERLRAGGECVWDKVSANPPITS